MTNLFSRFVNEEEGQDLIEYGLLAAFVSLAVIASIDAIGGSLNTAYRSFGRPRQPPLQRIQQNPNCLLLFIRVREQSGRGQGIVRSGLRLGALAWIE